RRGGVPLAAGSAARMADEVEWENGAAAVAKALLPHFSSDGGFFPYPKSMSCSGVNSTILAEDRRHRLLRRGFAAPSPPPTRRFRPKRICPLPPHVSPGLLSFHLSSSARRPSPKGHFADVHRGPPRRGRPSPRRHAQRHELRGATPYAHGGLSSTWGQPVLQRPRGRDAPALLSAPPSVRSAASLSQGFSLCRPCHPPSVGRWVRVRISLASGGAKFQSSLDSSCSAARLPLAGRPEVRGACKPRPMGASLFERGERGCEDFGPAPAAF
ncbi:unnamed protein product, partial [Prorocentrum cordatum]